LTLSKPELSKPEATQANDVTTMDTAERSLLASIQRKPDDPSIYNQLGLIYASTGEYDKSATNLQKAIECCRAKLSQLTTSETLLRNSGQIDKAAQALVERSKISVELSAAHS
jgi:tetratricopeptide (TPR) repeat protein